MKTAGPRSWGWGIQVSGETSYAAWPLSWLLLQECNLVATECPSELRLYCLVMSMDFALVSGHKEPIVYSPYGRSSPPADHWGLQHLGPWRPKIFYLLSPHHTKLTLRLLFFDISFYLLLYKCSWHFRCMELCKLHFPGYTQESRASAPVVFGITTLTDVAYSFFGIPP